jgi:DNA-binding response OmpR family regulator
MLKETIQRRAAQTLLAGAARGSKAGAKPLSMKEIQAEVNAVRRERRSKGDTGT